MYIYIYICIYVCMQYVYTCIVCVYIYIYILPDHIRMGIHQEHKIPETYGKTQSSVISKIATSTACASICQRGRHLGRLAGFRLLLPRASHQLDWRGAAR